MDETLELYLTTDQLGRVSLVSAAVTPSTYSEEESGESRLDRLAAAINLPAGTAVMDKKIVDLILPGAGENGGDRTVGVAFLSLWIGNEKWLLYISDEMDKSAFAEDILRTANASEAVPGQNYGATVYAYVDGSAAIWEDTRGFCFLLKGAHPDLAGTVSVTQSFFDVNN